MTNDRSHLSDQQIVLFADGEMSLSSSAKARAHLAACWECRTRMRQIEGSIADFVLAYRDGQDHPQIDSSAGSRALLKARLTQLAAENPPLLRPLRAAQVERLLAVVAVVVLLAATWTYGVHRMARATPSPSPSPAPLAASPVPNPQLTPGAVRLVTASEVCKAGPGNNEGGEIPASVRQKVLREYGLASYRPQDYELDYLITPDLGGADDLRNLWPEPHAATVWNSYVKDALEDRLRQMVCSGALDLSTAQRDIATDWISAYKKYFKTENPLPARVS